jgi:simple sugar transport system permease protein
VVDRPPHAPEAAEAIGNSGSAPHNATAGVGRPEHRNDRTAGGGARAVVPRLRPRSWRARILSRPEITPAVGAIAVFVFFAVVAGDSGFLSSTAASNYLEVAAQLGILVVFVGLLMIAGEFDVSIGSLIGLTGIFAAYAIADLGLPIAVAVPATMLAAGMIGLLNGFLVIKTGVPSFLVTLAGFFVFRGLTIVLADVFSGGGTQVGGVLEATQDDPLLPLFAGEAFGLPASFFWWIGLVAIGTWILTQTRFGNWTFATGGSVVAATKLGVPVHRVKLTLFALTSMSAAFVASIAVLTNGGADALQGELKEFQAIAAAVIGGCLITGGFGTLIGAAFGALIFGLVSQGIYFTDVNSDYFRVFLGGMLLAAVLLNSYTRRKAQEMK